jgi:hypothetical protein
VGYALCIPCAAMVSGGLKAIKSFKNIKKPKSSFQQVIIKGKNTKERPKKQNRYNTQ